MAAWFRRMARARFTTLAPFIRPLSPWRQHRLGDGSLSAGFNTVIPGASTSTSFAIIPMLDVAYYLNKNWAIEAICCVSPASHPGHRHDPVRVRPHLGVPAVSSVAISLHQFRRLSALSRRRRELHDLLGHARQRPDLAAGHRARLAAWPVLASRRQRPFYSATVTPCWGVVGQVGFDYMFNEHWGVNLDLKYIMMEPTVHANVAAFSPAGAGVSERSLFRSASICRSIRSSSARA